MKNKGLLLIAGGIAIAAAIIAWLMFGGEAPKNPENTASNAVVGSSQMRISGFADSAIAITMR